jgi:ATP synthase protein I
MQSAGSHSGDLSHETTGERAHRTPVTLGADAASPAARGGKRFYNALSASSVGLELGLSVVISLLFGMWLDGKLGTTPWLMLLWLVIGLAAGFRGVLRAVRRADREVPHG